MYIQRNIIGEPKPMMDSYITRMKQEAEKKAQLLQSRGSKRDGKTLKYRYSIR
jgi:hypothetical protein